MVADSTTASSMTVTGLCPAMGEGWLFFHPVDELTAELKTADTTLKEV